MTRKILDDRQVNLSIVGDASCSKALLDMKPFLKWAGGKSRLAQKIDSWLPPSPKGRLVEPFMGSGAVFLGSGRTKFLASDINTDLVDLFDVLRTHRGKFIERCQGLFEDGTGTTGNTTTDRAEGIDPDVYYDNRDKFNRLGKALMDEANPLSKTKRDQALVERAALFIYLNRHCFNGLCRYNSKGGFNVPIGQHKAPYFPAKEMEEFLNKDPDVEILCMGYEELLTKKVGKGDVVYCDPPYCGLSTTASFDSYAKEGFSNNEHIQLAQLCRKLAADGIPVLISNHLTKFTVDIYRDLGATAYQVIQRQVAVRRSISGSGASRIKAAEIFALFLPSDEPVPEAFNDLEPVPDFAAEGSWNMAA